MEKRVEKEKAIPSNGIANFSNLEPNLSYTFLDGHVEECSAIPKKVENPKLVRCPFGCLPPPKKYVRTLLKSEAFKWIPRPLRNISCYQFPIALAI